MTRPLLTRFPGLARRLTPLALADLPTPVRPLRHLAKSLGHPALYVKCDDQSSPLYGGNKVRKLEFLLGEARRKQAATLVTMGGTGSNHLLATALHGRANGMHTVGVVFPQPENDKVQNNLAADRGAGVELVRIPSKYLLPFHVARVLVRLRVSQGRFPHLIPGGGSSPLGALGFVNAGMEIAEQVRAGLLPEPGAVFLAYGTGGTAAGLALGLQLGGLRSKVVAVRVIDRLLANRPRLLSLVRGTRALLARSAEDIAVPARPGANVEILHGYMGGGYGVTTQAAEEAVALFREREDIGLEFTYTGKAAAAFIDRARATREPLLFWNTYSSADISGWIAAGS
jgi:D-cysteine desulfhydrase